MKMKSSKKGFTLVEIMIVVVIIGLLAAMAIPAFQKVRSTSQEKAIINNLRQFASAAQQYMLDEGASVAIYTDLVGSGKHIQVIEAVAGEEYTGLSVTEGTTTIAVTTSGGDAIIYTF